MRSFKQFCYFWLGVLLAALMLAPYAHAETVDSVKVAAATLWTTHVCQQPNNPVTAPTASQLHAQFIANWGVACPDGEARTVVQDVSSFNENSGGYFQVRYSHSGGGPFTSLDIPVTIQYSCPAGYTMSADGLSCSRPDCPPGTERNSGGDCVTPCPPEGDTRHQGKDFSYSKNISTVGGACINGCSYSVSGFLDPGTRQCADGYCFGKVGTSKGASCGATDVVPVTLWDQSPQWEWDPGPEPEPTNPNAPGTGDAQQSPQPQTTEEECTAKGMGYATMSGVTVCVPIGTGEEDSSDPESVLTPNPDGTQNKKTTSTNRNPDGSITETVGNCTIYANGETICTEPTTTSYSGQDSYCRTNPTAEICQNSKVSGGAGCDTAPVCSGDPAACANLFQQWKARCEIQKQNEFTSTAGQQPGTFADLDPDIQAAKDALTTEFASIRQQAAALLSFSSPGTGTLGCPTGDVAVGGHTAHLAMCFDKYEGQLSVVGSVVVFIAALIALFIVFS